MVRSLAPRLTGRRIVDATFSSKHVVKQNFAEVRKRVRGQKIHSVTRHGKYIVLQLDKGTLTIHLGMTGKLLLDAQAGPYTRALFELDEGLLVYDDIRHFGKIQWSQELPARVGELGPDALTVASDEFLDLLRKRRSMIKPLLMNQEFLRGWGTFTRTKRCFRRGLIPRRSHRG